MAAQQPYTDNPPPYGFQAPPGQPGYPPGQHGYPPGQPGYPPGQPGYPPGPQPPQVILVHDRQPGRTVLITHQIAGLGPNSLNTKCPSCQMQVHTRLTQEISTRTHLFALLLCLFGCWPCVPIPYCMDSCKNTNHHCPNCNAYIGTYQA